MRGEAINRDVRIVTIPLAAVPRPNVRWTDRECDAWLLRCVTDDARSCAQWKTVLRGVGIVALMIVGAMGVLAW